METRIDDMSVSGCYRGDSVDLIGGDELDQIIDDYGLMGNGFMGNDLDNVYMGGWLKKLVRRIRDRVRARRAARAASGIPSSYSVSTPGGVVSAGAGGFSFTPGASAITRGAGAGAGTGVQQAGIMGAIQKNPMLLAIPAGLMLFMLSQKKRGNGKK